MADYFHVLDFNNLGLKQTEASTNYTPGGYTVQDDSQHQDKAEAHNYTVLTEGQFSGTTNIIVNGLTDTHTNEVVYDNITGRYYSREHSKSVGPLADGNLYWDDTAGSNEDCWQFIDQANSASLAGFSDWRMPNLWEILAITNLENGIPRIDSTAFPALSLSPGVWTSNTHQTNTNGYELFGDQRVFATDKTTITRKVWLVRGGNI